MINRSEMTPEGMVTLLPPERNSRHTPVEKNKELESVLGSHRTRILVIGCGGGGNNTVTRLTEIGVNGVETLAINTDAQDLLITNADDKILIGRSITKGLGAGSDPQIGEDSARENLKEIEEALAGIDMVFITCGLGGGTGTGSAPLIAETAKKLGALTISVVTLPFSEEGVMRWDNARRGLEKLRQNSDTVIVIQNDRLLDIVPDMPLRQAFKVADETLVNAVKGITELITEKGLVNLDFADIRAVMQNGGTAMIGIGESEGGDRAKMAIEIAMQNQLLDVDITGAQSTLINITGGAEMSLKDARTVMKLVAERLDPSARIIWGARVDENLGKSIRVMLIVTGLQEKPRAAISSSRHLGAMDWKSSGAAISEESSERKTGDRDSKTDGQKLQPVKSKEPSLPRPGVERAPSATSRVEPPAKAKTPVPTEGAAHAPSRAATMPKPKTLARPEVERVSQMTRPATQPASPQAPIPPRPEVAEPAGAATRKTPLSTPRAPLTTRPGIERLAGGKSQPPPPRSPKVQGPIRPEGERNFSTSSREPSPARPQAPSPTRPLAGRPPSPANRVVQPPAPKAPAPMRPSVKRAVVPGTNTQPPLPARSTAAVSRVSFEEKTRANLQTICDSVGLLMAEPARQEMLRRIRISALAISNTAKRFTLTPIADYAATVQEVCERALNGELKMAEAFIQALQEVPAVLDSMIRGEADAFAEAKRHQEKLLRLTDALEEKGVTRLEINEREDKSNVSDNGQEAPGAAPIPADQPVEKTLRLDQHAQSDAEVMDYLNNIFPNVELS